MYRSIGAEPSPQEDQPSAQKKNIHFVCILVVELIVGLVRLDNKAIIIDTININTKY